MKPEIDNEQRYYAMPSLHRWFAVASVILLLCVIALIHFDHYRPWRQYQEDFRKRDVALTETRITALHAAIERKTAVEVVEETAPPESAASAEVESDAADDPFADATADEAPADDPFADATADEAPADDPFADVTADEAPAADPFADATADEAPAADPFADATADETPAADPFADATADEAPADDPFADATAHSAVTVEPVLEEAVVEAPSIEEELDQLSLEDLQKEVALLDRKLARISPEHMSFANRFIGYFRDLPILDLSSPTYKVEQLIVHDSKEDLHFTQVPRIDRCMTCHQGIDRALFSQEEEPLGTHPNLDLFVSPSSPHAKEQFGCTTCHLGRGRGTEFNSTSHTPADAAQETDWVETHSWKEDHHWEEPMLETPYLEASCLTCHRSETRVPGAEKLNWGLTLIEQAGCYGCHSIGHLGEQTKRGPSLQYLAAKSPADWVRTWIKDPKAIRPDTWMPHSFAEAGDKDPARASAEVSAITEYLFAVSADFALEGATPKGDPGEGKLQFDALGCAACHLSPEEAPLTTQRVDALRRMNGPHLSGLAAKTTTDWLFHWLKDPSRYNPATTMPDLRLSDEEAANLSAYLMQGDGAMEVEEAVTDDALFRSILREHRIRRETPAALDAALAAMDSATLRQELGKQLIAHYGCAGCHQIPGAEGDALIGPELDAFGDKSLHELDFGKQHITHRKSVWLENKLADPRIFDEHIEKEAIDQLRMPQYDFSAQEREALITALLGFRALPKGMKLERKLDPHALAIETGRALARKFNCAGCHVMEGEGGALAPILTQYLKKTKGYGDAEAAAMALAFGPPNLQGEGKKVQSAWLFDFLHTPLVIRPWVSVRMPTYAFTDEQRNSMAHYFSALDNEPFPFVSSATPDPESPLFKAGKQLFSVEYFDCGNCHIQGDKFPEGEPDRWAPDFGLSAQRLKPAWVSQWMYDPQVLEPGTKMPTYFDPEYFDDSGPGDLLGGDEHEHIKAICAYILGIEYDVPEQVNSGTWDASGIGGGEEDKIEGTTETAIAAGDLYE